MQQGIGNLSVTLPPPSPSNDAGAVFFECTECTDALRAFRTRTFTFRDARVRTQHVVNIVWPPVHLQGGFQLWRLTAHTAESTLNCGARALCAC